MPIFEFQCQDCQTKFETLVRHNEQAQCPTCQGEQLQKMISAHAVTTGQPETPCGSAPSPMCGSGGCGGC